MECAELGEGINRPYVLQLQPLLWLFDQIPGQGRRPRNQFDSMTLVGKTQKISESENLMK